jgi:hypothetical protein
MSFIVQAAATCPTCGAEAKVEFPASINADRRPDLRAAILEGTLATQPCRACGERLTFEPQMTFLDVGRRQWIFAESAEARAGWPEIEAQAASIFDDAFGPAAPEAARTIGAGLIPRLVFGWPALAEKLLCNDLGLDDIALEQLKFAAIAEGSIPTLYAARELRLTGSDENTLVLSWLDPTDGTPIERLRIPQEAYVLIKAGGPAWDPLAARIAGGMYVDTARALHPATQTAGAA